jgi:hypothetical protein
MTEFMKAGAFLGQNFDKWIDHCRKQHAPFFSLAEDINSLNLCLVQGVGDAKKGTVCDGEQEAILLRGTGIYEGIVLMAERGMVAEAGILTRTLVDLGMRFAVAAKSPENTPMLIMADKFQKRKGLRAALKVPNCMTAKERADFEKAIQSLDVLLAGKSEKNFPNQVKLAEIAGQTDFYNLFFRGFSGAVHSTPMHLKQHARVDKNGKGILFQMGPRFDLVPFYLSMAMSIHLELLSNAGVFFKVEIAGGISKLKKRLKSLGHLVVVPDWR